MTEVQPLVFPGSRVLAGWWKQLAARQPRALWVGHLLLHRVETLVELVQPSPLDSLAWFVLKGVHLAGAARLEALDAQLQLGALLQQALRLLESRALVRTDAQGSWALTPGGREALDTSIYFRPVHGRRVFYFREGEQPEQPPHWLAIRDTNATSSWLPAGDWRFEIKFLEACLDRPETWKERHGFPRELRRILGFSGPQTPVPDWQCVPLDRPERLLIAMVLARSPDGDDQLLGFAAQPEGWVLQAGEPVCVLGQDWADTFPELAEELAPRRWHEAWRNWCQPRGLPVAEIEACQLQPDATRLCIRAPDRLLERFRATRSDVLKGEAWLLAGSQRLRRAVRAEIVQSLA